MFCLRSIGRIRNLITLYTNAQLMYALITTRLDFVKVDFITFKQQAWQVTADTKPGKTYFKTTV